MDLRDAAKIASGLASRLEVEAVDLDSALGRVLAYPFRAGINIPDEFRSKWDGFALRSSDSAGASPNTPVTLDILPVEVTAGKLAPSPATAGTCFRIMTGAVLPAGADAVVPLEDVSTRGNRLVLNRPLAPEKGVILPGSDAARGELLAEEGDVLTPTRLAVIAAAGADRINVYRKPRVAVLSTGDELRQLGGESGGPIVFCNNCHLLANLVTIGGGTPVQLGIAPDNPDVIYSRLERVKADLVITTGGLGKGSRDFILETWRRLGVTAQFEGLNVSPGKGSALGAGAGRIFLGLPGNPWASQVVYEEIAAPMLRVFQGVRLAGQFAFDARITAGVKKKQGFYHAFYGMFSHAGEPAFIPGNTVPACSRLPQLRSGFAYILQGPDTSFVPEGEKVAVKIPDFPLLSWALLKA